MLLVKRGHEPGAGRWSVPGGILEAGESIYEGAARELEEETGLRARPVGIAAVAEYMEWRERDDEPKYHYVIIDVLFAEPVRGRLRASSDATEAGFFHPHTALRELELTETTRILLEELLGKKPRAMKLISVRRRIRNA